MHTDSDGFFTISIDNKDYLLAFTMKDDKAVSLITKQDDDVETIANGIIDLDAYYMTLALTPQYKDDFSFMNNLLDILIPKGLVDAWTVNSKQKVWLIDYDDEFLDYAIRIS